MKQKLQTALITKYKWLQKKISNRSPYPMFGIECDDGWYDLLDNLCASIDKVLSKESELEENFYVAQIKEKYGELRFYIYGGNDKIDDLISTAENKSCKVCELCGKRGRIDHTRGWLKTLCKSCRKADNKKMQE